MRQGLLNPGVGNLFGSTGQILIRTAFMGLIGHNGTIMMLSDWQVGGVPTPQNPLCRVSKQWTGRWLLGAWKPEAVSKPFYCLQRAFRQLRCSHLDFPHELTCVSGHPQSIFSQTLSHLQTEDRNTIFFPQKLDYLLPGGIVPNSWNVHRHFFSNGLS